MGHDSGLRSVVGSPPPRWTGWRLAGWRRCLGAAALLALAILPACGGGGGGGSPTEPTPTPTPAPRITFTAASMGPGIVLAQGAASTATSLVVEVRAASVTGLYGLGFDLDYPAAALHFQTATLGSFLGAAGTVSAQAVESSAGHLVVGASRLGPLPGVDGGGTILQLTFTPVATGNGAFTFSRNVAFHADGTVLNLSWAAGTVTVVR